MLVYEQGELIENIEFNVMSAQEDVKEAGVQLKKARKLQSSARHKKGCCVVLCLILVGAIALAIALGIAL
jgi:t-SNARE complex subunit (syntaxin)